MALKSRWRRIRPPVLRESLRIEGRYELLVEDARNQDVRTKDGASAEVDEHFECGERRTLGCVDDWHPRRIADVARAQESWKAASSTASNDERSRMADLVAADAAEVVRQHTSADGLAFELGANVATARAN